VNLDDIRVMVRSQLDLDDTDLPDALLDGYVRDGYHHCIDMERRWPFFEMIWPAQVDAGADYVVLPPDAAEVDMVIGSDGRLLDNVSFRWLVSSFNLAPGATTPGSPTYWYMIGNLLKLYPAQTEANDGALTFHGWRKPSDWIGDGVAANEVDADDRLHLPIVWYCCSLGYAQQEDEVLEATYATRYHEALSIAHDSIMRPWTGSPKQVAYTSYRSPSTFSPQLVFQLPPGP
jgi:hypothetical protein